VSILLLECRVSSPCPRNSAAGHALLPGLVLHVPDAEHSDVGSKRVQPMREHQRLSACRRFGGKKVSMAGCNIEHKVREWSDVL
jgi:hypothetical protein